MTPTFVSLDRTFHIPPHGFRHVQNELLFTCKPIPLWFISQVTVPPSFHLFRSKMSTVLGFSFSSTPHLNH